MTGTEWKNSAEDLKWLSKMKKTLKLFNEYRDSLREIEEEYERRFGYNPSEVGDDNWIDIFHQGGFGKEDVVDGGSITIESITENAKLHL